MQIDVMLRADKVLSPADLRFLATQVWPVVGTGPDMTSISRPCANPSCGRDLSHRPANAKFCEDCAEDRRRTFNRDFRRRVPGVRLCPDCGADISDRHGRAERCIDCAQAKDREQSRECWRRYNAKNRRAA